MKFSSSSYISTLFSYSVFISFNPLSYFSLPPLYRFSPFLQTLNFLAYFFDLFTVFDYLFVCTLHFLIPAPTFFFSSKVLLSLIRFLRLSPFILLLSSPFSFSKCFLSFHFFSCFLFPSSLCNSWFLFSTSWLLSFTFNFHRFTSFF